MQATQPQPRPPATIFVVDDDPAVCNSLKFSLEIEGFAVRTYTDGRALLNERDIPDYGCLVFDYNLTGMNGLELLAQMRQHHCELPAILITTHVSNSLRQRAGAAGMSVVEKPLMNSSLLDAINNILVPPSH
ncbi:MAG: response regulator [Bradyrhizobiaceae bacterium]|nr:response regulator [Bradyrhizobiaceae bacterium]